MGIDKDLFRLTHIKDCIEKINKLVTLLNNYERFESHWIEQDALIRNFEIIGEASSHISDNLKTKYPEVVWKEMKAMRNFMTHEYFGLQLDTIWETAVNDIPVLEKQIIEIINDLS
ncbi:MULTISPECIES: HepT-like ribonuclease domain-containing protein [Mesonia]|uniref:Uncharacterized protein n=1 Tax=Mesonia oceanica TaxID=2687242 RepID=A0AC61Y7X0_9FLAO|nr:MULTISPECIES: HepT-like ribonuclease domain-containing protein [Mesonia]MBJ97047.1 hypothetical protein [Flavobacteriaceae bacterium]MAN29475.1 hypothetical protein [Mesonia sp.]MAQ39454.1 hypothetical protein [Mesonia sp.]MAQ42129.1 hypothetical protein [Mesonia sp.]VVV00601.1 hypothetical protein FVB9532_01874 [Mesonia oceanica]|tara:strand:+ start:14153 stop:14500 length:348 start_codon:yes stop_codon:yes gene_type:complete